MRFSTFSYSSLGKKIYMAILGLLLVSFVTVHLIGNLALLSPDKDTFNKYSHFLTHDIGGIILVAEILIFAFFFFHFLYALVVQWNNWKARPIGYKKVKNAGGASKKTIMSTTMIYTGLIIIIWLVIHLLNFKYGEEVMYTTKDGMLIRDLYATVTGYFSNIWNVIFYDVVMILLALHLSHGFWSAFQSLGLNGPRFMKFIRGFGYLYAIVLGAGFVFIPVWVYLTIGGAR